MTLSLERSTSASPEDVYDVLADLPTHVEWGGQRQAKKTRLLTIDAPAGAATVGTEFETTGADPMGRFSDRSVVTQADRPGVFEFVTEATLRTKRGDTSEWTTVHRYEVRPDGDGSLIRYAIRIARISALPGMMRVLGLPLLSGIAMKASAKVARRGVENLSRFAEQRADAR
jgi:hypothetical protein